MQFFDVFDNEYPQKENFFENKDNVNFLFNIFLIFSFACENRKTNLRLLF